MSGADVKRSVRFAERVREIISSLLLQGRVHDPIVMGAFISRVTVTDDLRTARIFVRHQNLEMTEAQREALVAALARAGGFLRRAVGAELKARHTPELEFRWDKGVDNALRVESLLAEIRAEGAPEPERPAPLPPSPEEE